MLYNYIMESSLTCDFTKNKNQTLSSLSTVLSEIDDLMIKNDTFLK